MQVIFCVLVLTLTLQVLLVLGQKNNEVPEIEGIEWTHVLDLGSGVDLKWSNEDSDLVIMELSAPTKGWVSVGFSPNGGMADSDIVLGWVDNDGKPHIQDMYGVGNETPQLDEIQDYTLISARETDDRTTMRFSRKWNTCDQNGNDFILSNDTVSIIWAYNDIDPAASQPAGQFAPFYHGNNRGVRSTYVRSPALHAEFPDSNPEKYPAGVKHWDAFMDKNQIDGEDDVFYCKIVKFPDSETKHHLIGYRPLLVDENKNLIHHIIIYECHVPDSDGGTKAVFEQHLENPGGRCYTPAMPPAWSKYCINIPILWTSGSEGSMYPPNVGMPLGEDHNGTTYFMFEIHYDNPKLTTFEDSSGFRLFYTDTLRENEVGALAIGHKVSPFHVVPPGVGSWTSNGYCSGECTSQTIPDEGINVFSVLLHAHYSGRKITLHHIRDGKELETLGKENNYNYNYQQARMLSKPVKILPGDELITTCEYDTSTKTSPSFGGLGTRDEMCLSFLYVYPRIPLGECKSQPEFFEFLNALGVNKVEGEILEEINMPYSPKEGQTEDYPDNPFYLKNSTYKVPLNALDAMLIVEPQDSTDPTVGDLIRNLNWNSSRGLAIQNAWNSGNQYAFCSGSNKQRFPLQNNVVKLPLYEVYIEENLQDQCKVNNSTRNEEEMLMTSDKPPKNENQVQIIPVIQVDSFFASTPFGPHQFPRPGQFRPSTNYPFQNQQQHFFAPTSVQPSSQYIYPQQQLQQQLQQQQQQQLQQQLHQQQPYYHQFHQFAHQHYNPRPFYTYLPQSYYPLYYPSRSASFPQTYTPWNSAGFFNYQF